MKQLEERLKKLRQRAKYPVLVTGPNIMYFTGVGGLCGTLLILPRTEYLITRDDELAKKTKVANIVRPKKEPLTSLFEILRKEKVKRLGVDFSTLSIATYKRLSQKVKLVDVQKIISRMRSVKDKSEIEKIRQAAALSDKAMAAAAKAIKEGATERDVRTTAACAVLKRCEGLAFEFIVAAGPNSLFIHPHPTNRKIQKTDLVIVDLGVRVDGYHFDMTRTFCLAPSQQQLELYKKVLTAQKLAINKLKGGAQCGRIFTAIEKFVGEYKPYLKYGLGHGVGLEIHEPPSFEKGSKDILKENMVFTIEPGLHVPGISGVRIEDTILLTKKGPKQLTKFPKTLRV